MADASADPMVLSPTLTGLDEQMRASALLKQKDKSANLAVSPEGTLVDNRLGSMSIDPSGKLVHSATAQEPDAISSLNRQQRQQAQSSLPENTLDTATNKAASATTATAADSTASEIGSSYRQLISQARSAKGGLKDKVLDMAAGPISAATSKLLQESWLGLIESFGLTLIYINIHIFCRFVFGEKFFCKLGREWMPGIGKSSGSFAGSVKRSATSEIAKTPGSPTEMPIPGGEAVGSILGLPLKGMGLLEAAVVAGLDLLVIFIIFISLTPLIFLALALYAAAHPVAGIEVLVNLAKIIGLNVIPLVVEGVTGN